MLTGNSLIVIRNSPPMGVGIPGGFTRMIPSQIEGSPYGLSNLHSILSLQMQETRVMLRSSLLVVLLSLWMAACSKPKVNPPISRNQPKEIPATRTVEKAAKPSP